ncbi:MAG: DEAD/DEAH box helicase [Verrucomicrobia bacterium]|nr:DEAD/DEAH box helicase [Verrucomicrobiota bacterium]
MMMPFTRKMLMDWGGADVFRTGLAMFEKGLVQAVTYEHPVVKGTVKVGAGTLACQFTLRPKGGAENQCRCYNCRERSLTCVHMIAVGLELLRRQSDPDRAVKIKAEQRRAARLAQVDETAYLKRVPEGTPLAVSAALCLTLGRNWMAGYRAGRIPLRCEIECKGRRTEPEIVSRKMAFVFPPRDESLLFVLEDISEGPLKGSLEIGLRDFANLLQIHAGKPLAVEGEQNLVTVNTVPLVSILKLDMDSRSGELTLAVHNELPVSGAAAAPFYIIAGKTGWVFGAGQFWPLEKLLPIPFQPLYAQPVTIPRSAVLRFMNTELPLLVKHMPVATEFSPDMFSLDPAEPRFRMEVRGSPASLAATLYADYGAITVVAGKPDPVDPLAVADPEDVFRYLTRNPEREQQALQRVKAFGFDGERGDALTPVVGEREVLNVLGSGIHALRRLGWKVEFAGAVQPFMDSLESAMPVVHVQDDAGAGWFDVGFAFEDGQGQSLSESEIQRALLKGDAFIQKGGRTILLDSGAIESARDIFADCASGEGARAGTFRLDGVYAAYIKSSLDALEGIDVEARPEWLEKIRGQESGRLVMESAVLPPDLGAVMRPYQKEGVAWLRFLEQNQFGGILADDMGLGKTLQALAWLSLARRHAPAEGKPALIVCPSSLVDNWAEESAHWTPRLRVLVMSGGERHAKWSDLGQADIVVTSYALLRRDIELLAALDFAAVVLDEAQHIKNRSTRNAQATKRLKAVHRLVLTGTPIENSVADLWSIMDFLMPGYLGPYERFRLGYEAPIAQGGEVAEAAQLKLRRKLRPFMLRRLKQDVAKDLPPKIEKLATCVMTRDQQLVYKNLLHSSQRKISDLVKRNGFQRSRMEILVTLLRLRQTCCHLELLKLKDLDSQYPSGKLDLFFELLDEAIDGGHRVLVFSQFTSMLAILKRELEKLGLTYSYLDGATQNRLAVVKEFNTNRSIPVFLVSLKAGGTGLNLTGADMVIHFDPWWNPAVEAQATDRAHRIGQKRTVYSLKLITKDTVEEKVLAMQRRKQSVINATLADDEQVMQKLTWEDVKDLLSLN